MSSNSDKIRCQSCGQPLGEYQDTEGNRRDNFGTNADQTTNREYCSSCCQNGQFTQPAMTMEEMIALSVNHMVNALGIPESRASELALAVIPHLKRWNPL